MKTRLIAGLLLAGLLTQPVYIFSQSKSPRSTEPTHKQKIVELYKSVETGDLMALTRYLAPDYIQYNPAMADGIAGQDVFFTIQKASPLLRKGAPVVICASTEIHLGLAGSSVYAGSKAAIRTFARNLSTELVGRNIRVNVLTPGATYTPLYNRIGLSAEALEGLGTVINGMVPMHRFATAEEIARGALFLASGDSSYMLGAELVLDGGLSER